MRISLSHRCDDFLTRAYSVGCEATSRIVDDSRVIDYSFFIVPGA